MGNRGKKARENRPTGMIAVTGKKARAGGRKEKKDSIELVCQLNVIDTGAIEKSKKRGRGRGRDVFRRFLAGNGTFDPFLTLIYIPL